MPRRPEYPESGLTGPADTSDPSVRVSSTAPTPSETDLRRGTAIAATAIVPPTPPPLALVGEPRIESYELIAPGGLIVEVVRDLDSDQLSYNWTDRTVFEPWQQRG